MTTLPSRRKPAASRGPPCRTPEEARRFAAEDPDLVVWTLTPTEIGSAIWRRVREGRLGETQARAAEGVAEELLAHARLVRDAEAVKLLAARVLRVHPLRAADAPQLAAALAWSDGNPSGRVLHTFESRLGSAAQREGFLVIPAAEAAP